jgi:hypothetical protein
MGAYRSNKLQRWHFYRICLILGRLMSMFRSAVTPINPALDKGGAGLWGSSRLLGASSNIRPLRDFLSPLHCTRHSALLRDLRPGSASICFEHDITVALHSFNPHHPRCRRRRLSRPWSTCKGCRCRRTRSCMKRRRRCWPCSVACCRILVRFTLIIPRAQSLQYHSKVDSHGYALHAPILSSHRPRCLVQAVCAQRKRTSAVYPRSPTHPRLETRRRSESVVLALRGLPA